MGSIKNVVDAFNLVFSAKGSIMLANFIAVLVFAFFIFANTISTVLSAWKVGGISILAPVMLSGAADSLIIGGPLYSILIILISILSGTTMTMVIFKFKSSTHMSKSGGFASLLGVFSGALAASCPACTLALISVLGVSGGLAFLPFGGLEFSYLALGLLLFSLVMVSKSLVDCEQCKVKL